MQNGEYVMLKFNTLIVSILILTSCTTISVIPVGATDSGLYEEKVPVYVSRNTINKKYEEIAIITGKVDGDFAVVDDSETMDKILKKAQMIGADAVVFEETDYQSIRVTAIRFTE